MARRFVTRSGWLILATLLLGLSGCGGPADRRFSAQRSLLPTPVGIGTKLLLVEKRDATAFLVDAVSGDTAPLRTPVLRQPTRVVARAASADEALVLSAGVSGDRDAVQSPGGLTLVDSAGNARTFPLGNNPFDIMIRQPAGRYVALLRSGASHQLLENANEMALVDLDDESAGAVRRVTLPESPRAVFFSAGFSLEGAERPLAVAVTDNTAAVFDLANSGAEPVLIQLNADPSQPLRPQDVRFDALNGRLYIRSSGADDIFSLRLVPRTERPGRAAFAVSIDIVAAGRAPSDMQLFELDSVNYLLVIAEGSSSAVLVDVATSRTTAVRLPGRFDRARVYYTGEANGARVPHALLWDSRGGDLATLALGFSSTVLDRSLSALPSLPSGVRAAVPLADGTVAFLGTGPHITLVDPAASKVTPYNSQQIIDQGLLDEQRSLLWLAPRGQPRVAHLDLATGGTDDMLLDQDVRMATLVPGAARLAVVHDDQLGHITFIDLDEPRRGTSIGVRGFLVEGLFE